MLNHKSLVTAVLLGVGCAISAPAIYADTSVTVEKTHTGKHHYVYYGDKQIYFAPESKTYYWQTDGKWVSGTTLPEEDRSYVTTAKGVEFDLDTDRPYEKHEWVIAHVKHHDHDDD